MKKNTLKNLGIISTTILLCLLCLHRPVDGTESVPSSAVNNALCRSQITLSEIKPLPITFDSIFLDITHLIRQNKISDALAGLEKIQAIPLDDIQKSQCRYLEAMAHMAQNDYTAAGLGFMQIVVLTPDSPLLGPALFRLAQVHERIGRFDLAYKLYYQVTELPPSAYSSAPRGLAAEQLQHYDSVLNTKITPSGNSKRGPNHLTINHQTIDRNS